MTPLPPFGLDAPQVWDTEAAFTHLHSLGQADTKRTAERRLHAWGLLPLALAADTLRDGQGGLPNRIVIEHNIEQARQQRRLVLFAQLHPLPNGTPCLHANDARGARYWLPLPSDVPDDVPDDVPGDVPGNALTAHVLAAALDQIQQHIGKAVSIFPQGQLAALCRDLPSGPEVALCTSGYVFPLDLAPQQAAFKTRQHHTNITSSNTNNRNANTSPHLRRLEAESIHILREAVAEGDNPVMLYSVGKDSGVMLHLARKAFYPSPPPFPLLHVDTRWKFQEMYRFRDHTAHHSGMNLLVHINPEAIASNINPFDHGSALHTHITKTEGLKQALDQHKFDVVFGGARRDEEKSRAKERIFSFRTASHRWDPKNQRPEPWNLYNTRKNPGESIRVFPLSNWTELDIWHYIYQESIPVVPLYFAKERPVVLRDGMIMMVDDDRCRLLPGETIQHRKVRFRTLGCYPLTGAVESDAGNLEDIILELINARSSERQGRKIDSDSSASMEKKKQEGYF